MTQIFHREAVILFTFFLSGCNTAHGHTVIGPLDPSTCTNEYTNPEAENIDQLIAQSDSIALYCVSPFYENKQSQLAINDFEAAFEEDVGFTGLARRLRRPYYIHQLEREIVIYGNAAKKITLYGISNQSNADDEPFNDLLQLHSELVDMDDLFLGLARRGSDIDGKCIYEGHFIPSFNYLVFEGANSNAMYEPILDVNKDEFYLEVINRIKKIKHIEDKH